MEMTDVQKEFIESLKSRKNESNGKLIESVITVYNSLFEDDEMGGDEDIAPESSESDVAPESNEGDVAPDSGSEEAAPESDGGEDVESSGEETLAEAIHIDTPVEVNPNEQLISDLNGDLEREYMAAIQYIQHASVLTGPQYASIIDELLKHADEEIGHAKVVSDRINYLGGIPIAHMAPAKMSNDVTEMLNQDKAGEEDAITRYKERIQQADALKDFGTKQLLIEILEDEEEHRNDLLVFLGE